MRWQQLKTYATVIIIAAAAAACGGDATGPGEAEEVVFSDEGFTDWGWPGPYEKVSDESIQWLKDKGWWPLSVAYQSPWSGQNNVPLVQQQEGLMAHRGLEVEWTPFNSGPEIIEAFLAGQVQVGSGGNFPFTSLLDKKAPVTCVAVQSPNLLHATLVPTDSPLQSLEDLRGSGSTVGMVVGSSGEFYLRAAMENLGLEEGRDLELLNLTPPELQTLPKGVDAVVIWDPTVTFMEEHLKNARVIDSIYPYNMYMGCYYVNTEIVEEAPDVAQALVDGYVEAVLYGRANPDEVVEDMKSDPNLTQVPEALLKDQVVKYNNLYQPTFAYPFKDFWSRENVRIAKFLEQEEVLSNPVTEETWQSAMDDTFMRKTFERLGWDVPETPPWIPDGWTGEVGQAPYPEYDTEQNLEEPQPWPVDGSLIKPWQFRGEVFEP